MADILNITTPITPKDYQMPKYGQNQQTDVAGQVFNLGDQTKIVKTNSRTDEYAEQDLKDLGLAMPKSSSELGNVSGTLDVVKELLSTKAFEAISSRGDEDALRKLTEFAEEVILTPDNLENDIVNQQKNATIFSGKLWDALRYLTKSASSEDFSQAVLDFAKASANNAAKEEILSSLSSNFKYLSNELAPNKAVAEELMKASEALAGPDIARNYQALKSTLIKLVNYTSESLLLDNRTQNLLPLIIHTMSRYNDDPSALKRSFETLLNIFDNINFGEKTLNEVNKLLSDVNTENTAMNTSPEKAAGDISQDSGAGLYTPKNYGFPNNSEGAAPPRQNMNGTWDTADENTQNIPADNGTGYRTADEGNNGEIPQNRGFSDNAANEDYGYGGDPSGNIGRAVSEGQPDIRSGDTGLREALNTKLRNARSHADDPSYSYTSADTPQGKVRASLEKLFDDFILKANLPSDVKAASVINKSVIAEQQQLDQTAKLLTIGIQNMSSRVDTARLKDVLSSIDPHNGSESIKLVLASVTPNTPAMADALDSVIAHYDKTGDLSDLINRLGHILDSVDDTDKKIAMVQVLNETLSDMAKESGSNYSPPTSLDTLADFLVKNINDTALQSLTSMNRGDMVQNMLINPGAFNPLMHFFVPLDAYGMRAFGEIWVDKNDGRDPRISSSFDGEDVNHIFMCFDIENIGYFEMEMFAKGKNLSVMLLCPEGTESTFKPMAAAVPRIAAASGYSASAAIVDTLYRKRDLNTVFPDLNKRKGNLDAKA